MHTISVLIFCYTVCMYMCMYVSNYLSVILSMFVCKLVYIHAHVYIFFKYILYVLLRKLYVRILMYA